MRLLLEPPKWDALIGGTVETSWVADRHRKLEIATTVSTEIERVFEKLKARNSLFTATSASLTEDRFSAQWYVSLAGFSQKTLVNTIEGPKKFGMTQKPASFIDSISEYCHRRIHLDEKSAEMPPRIKKNLAQFGDWITAEIDLTFPAEVRSPERAVIRVALLLGGLIIGRGQNQGGNEGVTLLKEFLFHELRGARPVEYRAGPGTGWNLCRDMQDISTANVLRFKKNLECDFTSGGNRPDFKISFEGEVIAVGEIKARKDLSNVWESWMPQVVGHMRTWRSEFPNAARLFFGTVITPEMVNGISIKGTQHTGLRELHDAGELTSAYNLSQLVDLDRVKNGGLQDFVSSLKKLL